MLKHGSYFFSFILTMYIFRLTVYFSQFYSRQVTCSSKTFKDSKISVIWILKWLTWSSKKPMIWSQKFSFFLYYHVVSPELWSNQNDLLDWHVPHFSFLHSLLILLFCSHIIIFPLASYVQFEPIVKDHLLHGPMTYK